MWSAIDQPDDPTAVRVLDGGEVQPPLPRRRCRRCRPTRHVRIARAEVPLDQVGRDAQPGHPDRRSPALAGQQPRQTGGSHQPLDPLAPDPDPVLQPQLGVDARRAVDAVRGGVDLP